MQREKRRTQKNTQRDTLKKTLEKVRRKTLKINWKGVEEDQAKNASKTTITITP